MPHTTPKSTPVGRGVPRGSRWNFYSLRQRFAFLSLALPHAPEPSIERLGRRLWIRGGNGRGCWEFRASTKNGYGYQMHFGKPRATHRWTYAWAHGLDVDAFKTLDHLCRNRKCCNPTHLEEVTPRENCLRGISLPAQNARKTHCKRGHEFTPENIIRSRKGGRSCRACAEAYAREYLIRQREVLARVRALEKQRADEWAARWAALSIPHPSPDRKEP